MNPYRILDIDPGASRREILQAVGRALRERQHSIHEVATAQRELTDPLRRATHDFLQIIDLEPMLERLPPMPPCGELAPAPALATLELGDDG